MVFHVEGDQPGERLGSSVGLSTSSRQYSGRYAIGAPGWDGPNGVDAGRTLAGNTLDGTASLATIVQGPGTQSNVGGSVAVITDFSLLQAGFIGAAGNGSDVVTIGDTNGDGYDDVIYASGTANILSGKAGDNLRILETLDPNNIGANYGFLNRGAAGRVEDVNGDGVPEILIGDAENGIGGRMWLISGLDLQLLATASGPSGSRFGWSVAGIGDYDGDGTPDYAVGGPGQPLAIGTAAHGAVWIFSGRARGTVFPTRLLVGPPASEYGYAIAPTGDLNGDGLADLLVGGPSAMAAPGSTSPGYVWWMPGSQQSNTQFAVISGPGRNPLLWGPQPGSRFGHALAVGRDFDGNGNVEFAIGSPNWDKDSATPDAGRMDYFEFDNGPARASWTRWGTSCASSTGGAPRTSLSNRPALGQTVDVLLSGAPANSTAVLFMSGEFLRRDLDLLGMPGCDSYVHLPITSITYVATDASGRATISVPLPNLPGLQGRFAAVQWLIADVNANRFGAITSDAIVGNLGM